MFNFWTATHGRPATAGSRATTPDLSGRSGRQTAGVTGEVNSAYADDVFAIFAGTGGAVIVDASGRPVGVRGMQFAADG